jgi:hypothetical protein
MENIRSKAMLLASNLVGKGYSRKDACTIAWYMVHKHETSKVSFFTVDGNLRKRVVMKKFTDYYTPVGGRPSPEHVTVMVDTAKWAAEEDNFVISAHTERIVDETSLSA